MTTLNTTEVPKDLIPFEALRRRIPSWKPGALISFSTLHRWRASGVRGVRLRAWLVGGRWFTTEAALAEFVAAQNNGERPISAPAAARHQGQVDAELDRNGF